MATYLITKLLATCDFKVTVITGTRNPTKIGNVDFIIDEAFRISNKPARWLYFLNPSVKKRYGSLMKKFDIIYIPYGYPLIPLAKELNKKVIVHLHDYQPIAYNSTIIYNQRDGLAYNIKTELAYELLEHNGLRRAIAGSFLVPITTLCRVWVSEADIIICVSRRQAKIISNRAPELARKIRVVYNPLPETPPLEEKLKSPMFTYVGGESYVKGFHIFMRGALNVLKQRNNIRFLLAGSFSNKKRELLEKMRFKALASGDKIEVWIPPYRIDILHPVDLAEDVAMAYGYDNIGFEILPPTGVGKIDPVERFTRKVRDLMIGLQFQEVASYMMSNPRTLVWMMRLENVKVVEVENPKMEKYTALRNWLIPGLLEVLSYNKHLKFPLRIFEVGDVAVVDEEMETGVRIERRLGAVIYSDNATLTDAMVYVKALLKSLGLKYEITEYSHPSFIEGRCGRILSGNTEIGFLGEIHPEVILNFELEAPVAAFELNLTNMLRVLTG